MRKAEPQHGIQGSDSREHRTPNIERRNGKSMNRQDAKSAKETRYGVSEISFQTSDVPIL
ncbi:MAG: hypothetical protein RLZZ398_2003 [Verrucomicrobiota bacterium]|jgi:hypothetical protein